MIILHILYITIISSPPRKRKYFRFLFNFLKTYMFCFTLIDLSNDKLNAVNVILLCPKGKLRCA